MGRIPHEMELLGAGLTLGPVQIACWIGFLSFWVLQQLDAQPHEACATVLWVGWYPYASALLLSFM